MTNDLPGDPTLPWDVAAVEVARQSLLPAHNGGHQGINADEAAPIIREACEAWAKQKMETLRHQLIWTDRQQEIEKALAVMTDEWIENGEYCEETVTSLRDALRVALPKP